MCDWDDDFGDGFDDDVFMGEDSFEDEFEADPIEEPDLQEPEGPELEEDGFTARDAFFVGAIVGNAYEEARDERRRRELMRKKQTKREI